MVVYFQQDNASVHKSHRETIAALHTVIFLVKESLFCYLYKNFIILLFHAFALTKPKNN